MGIQPRTLYAVFVSRFLFLLAASCDIEEVGGEEGVGRKDLHMDRFPPSLAILGHAQKAA